tara:strand:+ start:553 stop:1428 length:876 start_codon:yes stop_codon:yes gene_type:complete
MYSLKQNKLLLLCLCLPAIFIVAFFIVYPILNGVYMSFTNASPLRPTTKLVGFENYRYLFQDDVYWQVLGNTIFIIGTATVIAMLVSLGLALLLNNAIRFSGLYRSLIFQTWVVPWIVIAILWGWLFNTDYGLVNGTLTHYGIIEKEIDWLFNGRAAQWSIILCFAWRSIPFLMVIMLAALQGVPNEVIDAAEVDGAGYWQKTFKVTLPLIQNISLAAALMQAVRMFQEMTLPFVLTEGGPMNSTMVLSMYSYNLAFDSWDFALAATVGTLWLIMLVAFGALYLKTVVREV